MLAQDLNTLTAVLGSQDWRLTTLFLLVAIPITTYLITSIRSAIAIRSQKDGKRPAVVPYWIPFFGNMFEFLWDTPAFALSLPKRFGYDIPLRVRIGPFKASLVSSAEHFEVLLKGGKELNSNFGVVHWMKTLFGLPSEIAQVFYTDNSGIASTPAPGTNVPPQNRHFHLRHAAATKYLYGPHLKGMTSRFIDKLGHQMEANPHVQEEWVEYPDLIEYLRDMVFRSATSSLCGDYIFDLNPTFTEDFWEYIDGLGVFLKGMPRWMSPGPFKARDRVLAAIQKWQLNAWEKTEGGKLQTDEEFDPYFGAKIMKTRYMYGREIEAMTDFGRATEDLGMIFATNANAVPGTIWLIIEFLRDPSLLKRGLAEISDCRLPSSDGHVRFDISKLCEQVVLQSVLSETLRLRVAVGIIRVPDKKDYTLGKWRFPKDGLMFMSSATAAQNEELWNAGTDTDPHPLNEFWSDRFIVDPKNPRSGPLKRGYPPIKSSEKEETDGKGEDEKPRFSMEGLGGGMAPFGGGVRMCPGRFFAKNEMLSTFALLCTHFEIDLRVPDGFKAEPDMRFYGVGIMPPKDKIPFRIRRRVVSQI